MIGKYVMLMYPDGTNVITNKQRPMESWRHQRTT